MDDDRTLDRSLPIALTLMWLAAVLLVNPSGNFPITDDWSYGYAVKALVARHEWRLSDWTSVPLATQVVWGALFCLPAGFSFLALRVSTLVLAWASGIGMYRLTRVAGAAPAAALVAALTLLFCPVFFGLAFTFMTDVPFLALTIWAAFFAVRSMQRKRTRDLVLLVVLLTGATLIRQLGVAMAAAAAVGSAVAENDWRRGMARALAIAGVPIAALLVYNAWLARLGTPVLYHVRERELSAVLGHPLRLLRLAEIRGLQAYVYAGLFAVPVAWLARASTPRVLRVSLAAVPAAVFLARGRWLPLNGGVLYDAGLNPTFIARPDLWPHAPATLWIGLTVAAFFGAAALGAELVAAGRAAWRGGSGETRGVILLCVLGAAGCLAPSSILSDFFDRYVLATLALTIALAAAVGLWRADHRGRLSISFAVLALVALFDIAAVHDFLAYDRARWAAVGDLLAAGMPPSRIEGGYDVNGWIAYRPNLPLARRDRWWDWSVASPDARLSLGPLDGYRISASYPFARWLGAGSGAVDVLTPVGR